MKKLTNKQYQKKCDDEQFNRLEKEIMGSVIDQRLEDKGFQYIGSVKAKYSKISTDRESLRAQKLEVVITNPPIIDEIVLIPLNLYGYFQTTRPIGYAVYIKKGALS